ncbi:MAG: hypothetical protein JJT82_06195 [Legionellaceae bacterium]|nr:hypothetical protein [Legionellaceae bacterium]
MRIYIMMILGCLGLQDTWARCDPTRFMSRCEIPYTSERNASRSQVFCGDRLGYISREQYEVLRRYQRANINMILTLNGEYIDSPCIPAGKYLNR